MGFDIYIGEIVGIGNRMLGLDFWGFDLCLFILLYIYGLYIFFVFFVNFWLLEVIVGWVLF